MFCRLMSALLLLQIGSASTVPVSNSTGSAVDPIFEQIAASPDGQAATRDALPAAAAALTAAAGAATLLLAALA